MAGVNVVRFGSVSHDDDRYIARNDASDTLSQIIQDTNSSANDAVQTAAHAALDSTIAGKVDKGSISVDVRDHGAVGDGVTNDTDAFTDALSQIGGGGRLIVGGGKTYNIDQIQFTHSGQSIEIQDGCELRRASTSAVTAPMVTVNRNKIRIFGGGAIQCDNACPDGIVRFERTGGAAEWCRARDIQVKGPGAGVSGSQGVVFAGPGATYQNVVGGLVISDVDTGFGFIDSANMNTAVNCTLYNIGSTGYYFDDGNENCVIGGSISSSHGVVVIHITGSSRINRFIGLIAEPGVPATFRNIDSGCERNQLIACSDNTSSVGTDNGSQTLEITNNIVKFGADYTGFFDKAAVTRPTVPAAGTVTADDLRAALISLGLVQ